MLGISHELEARMMATVVARRKMLAVDAGHLMHVAVNHVVYDPIDSRLGNVVARLV
jgi:hypothetical protein